ncbi:MAG: hypothetical protein GYA61_05945 [Spirochaetales bacterium]|nr:hypothetical protein [Spirochaetales bacterium]
MKRYYYALILFIFVLIIMSFLNACIFFQNIIYDKVFLFYIDGANNLDDFAIKDFDEIISGYCENENNCVALVLIDRMYDGPITYEDWDDTRLYKIVYNPDGELEELSSDELGLTTLYIDEDLDMGNPETIQKFCEFAVKNYPSKHYYLDIWNHGGGWRSKNKEICSDEESESVIYMRQLRSCLLKVKNFHLDLIILDACNMATLEVAYNFIDLVDYIIFSQKPIPADGMPYKELISSIFSKKDIEVIIDDICTSYVNYYIENNNNDISISALKIDKDKALLSFIDKFKNILPSISISALRQQRDKISNFAQTTVDFSVFSLQSFELENELSKIVISNYPELLTGISIYFPKYPSYDNYVSCYNPENVYFCEKYPFYLDFILSYNHSGIENCDSYEPNGSKTKAFLLQIPFNIQSYIWCENDYDYFTFPVITNNGLKIILIPPEECDYDLKIYYYKNSELYLLQSSLPDDSIEEIAIEQQLLSQIEQIYILVYGSNESFNQTKSYTLKCEYY